MAFIELLPFPKMDGEVIVVLVPLFTSLTSVRKRFFRPTTQFKIKFPRFLMSIDQIAGFTEAVSKLNLNFDPRSLNREFHIGKMLFSVFKSMKNSEVRIL